MIKLIIDAAKKENILFMIVTKEHNYSITHENTKANFEKNDYVDNRFFKIKKSENK